MSKKKGKKNVIQDFTIHDSANAMKPVKTIRKSITDVTEPSWDEIPFDTDIIEEACTDGTKKFTYKQKKTPDTSQNHPGQEYPEIIWYLISKFILPEDIGSFARINKATYNVTRNKSFWLLIYKKHCEKHPRLPEKLRSNSCKAYGLRQTVIRALYHTYDIFVTRLERMASQDSPPHILVNRKCVNVWLCKSMMYWSVYFKLKKPQLERRDMDFDVLEELARIDANPEEDTQVLQVTCKRFQDVPPLMGMTLSSVSMNIAQGFRHHRLTLGFNSTPYSTKGVMPECSVVLDAVIATMVSNWWHPTYPHEVVRLPRQEPPLLKRNFFDEDHC